MNLTVAFHQVLARRALLSLKSRYPGDYRLTVRVCDFEGQPICSIDETDISITSAQHE